VLGEMVDGDWSDDASWDTAVAVVEGFMDYWESNRAVFRVVELTTVEGDLRFQGLRYGPQLGHGDLARVIAHHAAPRARRRGRTPWRPPARSWPCWPRCRHRYGFEFWGSAPPRWSYSQARLLHWSVTGRPARRGSGCPVRTVRPPHRTGRRRGRGGRTAKPKGRPPGLSGRPSLPQGDGLTVSPAAP